jgi:hypothetical protein
LLEPPARQHGQEKYRLCAQTRDRYSIRIFAHARELSESVIAEQDIAAVAEIRRNSLFDALERSKHHEEVGGVAAILPKSNAVQESVRT